MDNGEIAGILDEIGDVLEIQGANAFRVRAYRMAAQTVRGWSDPMSRLHREGELEKLPGVGSGIAEKIVEILETGTCQEHRELLESPEGGLLEVVRLPGVGPKRAKLLLEELGVRSLADLEDAARAERVRELPGLGAKTEAKMLDAIRRRRKRHGRHRLDVALARADELTSALAEVAGVERVEVAGSARRREETIGDLDLLVTCDDVAPVMDAFASHERVEEVLARGETKSRVRLRGGMECDLRVVPDESFGAALHYFTGSKEHNIALRKRAVRAGLKVNEYGVFRSDEDDDDGADERIAGAEEEDVFAAVGLPWIPPELRQGRGELEAAGDGELPDLVRLEDIRGDCQMHTDWSDGRQTLEEMTAASRERGYAYIAITDHSQRVAMAGGLDEERLRRQWEEIDALNETLDDFRVLRSVEVDILRDGDLDLATDCLAEADLVVASVHYDTDMDRDRMTERILRGLDNPHVHVLAHPTGRRILERDPYPVDVERLIEAAAERGVLLECNAAPGRLDLRDVHLQAARAAGVRIVISTDAHAAAQLDWMRFGVATARRGWLEADDVANTRDLDGFLGLLRT